jgi:hypothetical protein
MAATVIHNYLPTDNKVASVNRLSELGWNVVPCADDACEICNRAAWLREKAR